MKRVVQILLAALVVVCCSATNTDVCLNPSNPSYNNLIQFKQIDVTTTYLELPRGRDFNISTNQNCWTFEWDELDIFQRTSSTKSISWIYRTVSNVLLLFSALFDDHFYARMTGVLYWTCQNPKRYEVELYQRCSQSLVQIQSHQIESASLSALDLHGKLNPFT